MAFSVSRNASGDLGLMEVFLSRPRPRRWSLSKAAHAAEWVAERVVRLGLRWEPREVHANERLVEIPFVLQRLPRAGRLIDIGATGSALSLQLASLGYQVTAIDVREYPFAHPNLVFVRSDVMEADLGDRSYDGAILVSTLEHMGLGSYGDRQGPSDEEFLARVARWVRRGGHMLVTVPFGRPFIGSWYRVYDSAGLRRVAEPYRLSEALFARRLDLLSWEICEEDALASVDSSCQPMNGVAMIQLEVF